jgi:hypothetical protein
MMVLLYSQQKHLETNEIKFSFQVAEFFFNYWTS